MRFSELLTDLRKEYNLSQMQLAEQIGVSQSTIAKLEIGRNEATASTLAKAAFFDVSTDYLLGLSDEYEGTGKSATTAPAALPLDESELLRNYRALSYAGKARVHTGGLLTAFEDLPLLLNGIISRLWSLIFSGVLSRNNRTPRQRAKSPYHCTAHNSTRARGRLPSSLPATTLAPARTPAPPVQALCP